MLASAVTTFVGLVGGAYILGEEGQPLEVTEEQARALLRDGMIVLAEGERLPENAPKAATPKSKQTSGGVL